MHYLLLYEYTSDYLAKRDQYRNEHLRLAWEAHARGELVLAGVLTDPIDSAVLMFKVESKDIVERFAAADPYVQNGLVNQWSIRQWNTSVGADAANPVKVD